MNRGATPSTLGSPSQRHVGTGACLVVSVCASADLADKPTRRVSHYGAVAQAGTPRYRPWRAERRTFSPARWPWPPAMVGRGALGHRRGREVAPARSRPVPRREMQPSTARPIRRERSGGFWVHDETGRDPNRFKICSHRKLARSNGYRVNG